MADDKARAQIQLVLDTVPGAMAHPVDWWEEGRTWEYLYKADTLLFTKEHRDEVRERFLDLARPHLRLQRGSDEGLEQFLQTAWNDGLTEVLPELLRLDYTALRGDLPLPVPAVLDRLDEALGNNGENGERLLARKAGTRPPQRRVPVDPDVVAFASGGYGCPAYEPETLPPGVSTPYPNLPTPTCRTHNRPCDGDGVRVAVLDTGLSPSAAAGHSWLSGVTGELDPPGSPIGYCEGHGTFSAGVLRTTARNSTVRVFRALEFNGHAVISDVAAKLSEVLDGPFDPQVVLVCFVTLTRDMDVPLAFQQVFANHPKATDTIAFVAPAGNDGLDGDAPGSPPVWPAQLSQFIAVGALDASWRGLASFSNHGSFVDVYAPGTHLANAFPRGTYLCHEPPMGQVRTFSGMADWSGTSFSSPMVAGAIAARMTCHGESAPLAAREVVARAGRLGHFTTLPVYWPGDGCC